MATTVFSQSWPWNSLDTASTTAMEGVFFAVIVQSVGKVVETCEVLQIQNPSLEVHIAHLVCLLEHHVLRVRRTSMIDHVQLELVVVHLYQNAVVQIKGMQGLKVLHQVVRLKFMEVREC
ncbi:hypothetical protein WICPIJ_009282 [Wickerhamomyces pijperi]|uniref:Uncharacterized protein n=1 Tax=Wickerhamomyces pijperi TaxID=599730 RepID=A0A9P8PPL6_WICPI|nr:hypothetical protein WICPIJ_009282 [Wickerhamomyces pijperi]